MSMSVFNPLAPFNSSSTLSPTFKKHENTKHQAYGQGICVVEHASFKLHLYNYCHVYNRGLAHEATVFYKRLAFLLSAK